MRDSPSNHRRSTTNQTHISIPEKCVKPFASWNRLLREAPKVPLADRVRLVPDFVQVLREHRHVERHGIGIAWPTVWVVDACVDHVPARQDGAARRGANRLHVVVIQDQALCSQRLQVRNRHLLRAMPSDVIPPQIVGNLCAIISFSRPYSYNIRTYIHPCITDIIMCERVSE